MTNRARRISSKLILSVACWMLFNGRALAHPPQASYFDVVDVTFRIDVDKIKRAWTAKELSQILTETQKQLTEYLQSSPSYGFWNFAEKSQTPKIKLSLLVLEKTPNEISLRVELAVSGNPTERFDKLWMAPDQTRDKGYRQDTPQFVEAFKTIAIPEDDASAEGDTLFKKLLKSNVALAKGEKFVGVGDDLLLVVPLKWERYEILSDSIFNLKFRAQRGGLAELESVGQGKKEVYRIENEDINALVILPISYRSPVESFQAKERPMEIKELLKNFSIFLKEVKSHGGLTY